ncbi:MAG: acetyl-CoA carboxylase, biotin carboxyl carrier protein [Erysipelotrichaceae bacterium]|nr:acetyl-CoA carboxylase, biotin carboxyl carrier protein [Erysipelotrichaceae bacterium]
MDTDKIKIIMELFEKSDISKMYMEDGDFKLTLEKNVEIQTVVKNNETLKEDESPKEESVELKSGVEVKSPLVGTYYQASGENQPPFVSVGDEVKVGDTLCIVEAMKVMNEIKSQVAGRVQSIKVENGEAVEYDQVLMVIE